MSSPDVVGNGLVEENWLLAHDGQPTPDVQDDEWRNNESNVKRSSQTILDCQPQPDVERISYLTKGTLRERISLPSMSKEPSSKS